MADEKLSKEELQKQQGEYLGKLKELGWKVEDTNEFKGIKNDLTGERKSRQQYADENEQLKEQINILMDEQDNKKKGNDDELGGDDEFLTVGKGKKLLKIALDEAKEEGNKKNAEDFHNKFVSDEREAKEELTAEKMGEGLDYSTVVSYYKELVADNPGFNQIVKNAGLKGKNMAKTIYDLVVKHHPEISKKVETLKHTTFLEDLKTGKSKKKGQEGVLDALRIEEKTTEDLLKMSEEEILRSLKEEE